MDLTRSRRRLSSVAVATALALPLSVTVVAPASAAVLADVPYGYGGYGGYGAYGPVYGYGVPYGYPSYGGGYAAQQVTDTSDATATQSEGLVQIDSVVDFGAAEAAGTGIVLRSDGIVVTNHHVVEGATSIRATVVSTGRTYTARLLGADATRDVAVLKLVGASGLDAVTTDDSGVDVGQAVTAVGDADGDGGSLTAAPGEVTDEWTPITVTADDGTESRLRGLIEVTSDIVPGDSGGALLDSSGEVVGMNVAASSGSADITGYVIPIARVLRVEQQVLGGDASGSVELGYDAFLGIELGSTSPVVAGLVEGGPAETAGVPAGATITSVGGRSVSTADELRAAIAALTPGDSVTVTWSTGSAQVVLGRAPVA